MTIQEIAREAGVSASSVSRVINGKPGVNAQARAKVLSLLKKHKYTSEKILPYVQEDSRLVGILVPDVRTVHHTEGAYHISQALSELGYSCIIDNTGPSDEQRIDGIKRLRSRNVKAAVMMGSIFESEMVKAAIAQYLPEIPVFMLNGFLDLPNVCGVLSDERSGVRDCVHLLEKKGRRRIALLMDEMRPSSLRKEEGFVLGMRDMGIPEEELWIERNTEPTLEGGYRAALRLMEKHPDMDGLICSLDIIACGAIRAFVRSGVDVPGQIAVIGIDNSLYAEICIPQLTSLDNMVFDSGVAIAHKLTDYFEGLKPNQKTMLFTSIVEREST